MEIVLILKNCEIMEYILKYIGKKFNEGFTFSETFIKKESLLRNEKAFVLLRYAT